MHFHGVALPRSAPTARSSPASPAAARDVMPRQDVHLPAARRAATPPASGPTTTTRPSMKDSIARRDVRRALDPAAAASARADREFVVVLRDPRSASRRSTAARSSATRRCCTPRVGDSVQWDVLALGDEHPHLPRPRPPLARRRRRPRSTRSTVGPAESLPRALARRTRPGTWLYHCHVEQHMMRGDDRPLPGEEVRRALLPRPPSRPRRRGAQRRRDRAPPSTCPASSSCRRTSPRWPATPVTWTNSDQVRPRHLRAQRCVRLRATSPPAGGSRTSPTLTGDYAVRRTNHPFMAGSVDVDAFQLLGPTPRHLRRLAGDAARHRARRHALGARSRPAARTSHGRRSPRSRPRRRLVPRPRDADAPTDLSRGRRGRPGLPLPLRVGAALDTRVTRLKAGRFRLRATARPAQAGARAALQLYSRERFRWRQVAHATVDRSSRVSFTVSPPGRYAAGSCSSTAKAATARASARRSTSAGAGSAHRARRPRCRASTTTTVATCGSSARGPAW